MRNLLNVKDVAVAYGARTVLDGVTLGVAEGERIGVVGRNGDGKSTLLRLLAGSASPDAGAVTRTGGVSVGLLAQGDALDGGSTIRSALLGDAGAAHELVASPRVRSVLVGLLGGPEAGRFSSGLETVVGSLSGGERRRVALAALLLSDADVLLLDEPTNHLDVEGVDWLARWLGAWRGTLVVVTHDRWFLDAVCTRTWEVGGGLVHQYEGGYAAYVLARAERARQAAAREERRQQLLRKELAWLQRGPPARTSKPRFRVDAAQALVADEPEPRDRTELLRFASARLGSRVLAVERASVGFDGRPVLRDVSWELGPGDRIGLVGVNGSGKTTLVRLLAGALAPSSGRVEQGATVRLAVLSQSAGTEELPGSMRALEALTSEVRGVGRVSDGRELTPGMLAERFGFAGDRGRTLVRDLSGGERRRLQLMRLLVGEPNVLVLDEPTNDLDIDTLTALEDLLDGWPGTLVVVSHDRYFVERVCDDVWTLDPTAPGGMRHLPGGIDQYLADRPAGAPPTPRTSPGPVVDRSSGRSAPSGGERRAAQKEVGRLERALEKLAARAEALQGEMAASATDHARLGELTAELDALTAERDEAEAAWLEASEVLER